MVEQCVALTSPLRRRWL